MNLPIKILLVDDSLVFSKATTTALNLYDELQVIGSVSDGLEVIPYLQENKVDVILMDINMRSLNGIDSTILVKYHFPLVQIIGLSNDCCKEKIIKAGALDCLDKWQTNAEEIRKKILECLVIQ